MMSMAVDLFLQAYIMGHLDFWTNSMNNDKCRVPGYDSSVPQKILMNCESTIAMLTISEMNRVGPPIAPIRLMNGNIN